MRAKNGNMAGLTLLFAVMMSIPWLVPHLGFVALAGFVPLLYMERLATRNEIKRFWMWHYAAFVLWNAFTTFWVCNATIGGGVFAILANALQMSLVFGLFRLAKKYMGGVLPYVFLAAAWIAWERFYFSAEISWPWLVLGNAFARSTHLIQWYEYTGTLGGSLWIWVCNLGLYAVIVALEDGSVKTAGKIQRVAAVIAMALVVLAPPAVSLCLYSQAGDGGDESLDVIIAQPNFNPYEKFESMDQASQTNVLLTMMEGRWRTYGEHSDNILLLAPETFTSDIRLGMWHTSDTWRRMLSFLNDKPSATILFGASSFEVVESVEPPSSLARRLGDGLWLRTHNSALTLNNAGDTEIYHKSRLVVGVEKTPYPKLFTRIDDMLGGVMGRNEVQEEVSLLHCGQVPLGCAICYESVYGEYCAEYVRKGARALAVITNDAWWGDTPGYRQHLSYSSLRAIELRRDVARCANTGISAFIDHRGNIVSETEWWKQDTLDGQLTLNSDITFFVKYGDMTGRVCTLVFILLALSLCSKIALGRKYDKKVI